MHVVHLVHDAGFIVDPARWIGVRYCLEETFVTDDLEGKVTVALTRGERRDETVSRQARPGHAVIVLGVIVEAF